MGVPTSCGQPLFKENCFIFHMLRYKLFIWAGPLAHFVHPLFKSWLKAWLAKQPERSGTVVQSYSLHPSLSVLRSESCGIDCKLLVKTMLGWESCCTVKINDCLQLIVLVLFTLWKMTKNKDGSKAKHWESDYQVNVEVFFKQQDSWSLQTLFLFLFQVI